MTLNTELPNVQKIVSITTRINIKRIPLTCGYARQLAEGRQWSYLGCNDHGQVLAHAALSFL